MRQLSRSLLACLLFACSGESMPAGPGVVRDTPVGPMMSLRSDKTTVEPRGETYRCWYFKPEAPEGAGIKAMRFVGGPGVHHIAIYTSTQKEAQVEDCWNFGVDWGLVGGGGVNTGEVAFPDGIAMPVRTTGTYVVQLH